MDGHPYSIAFPRSLVLGLFFFHGDVLTAAESGIVYNVFSWNIYLLTYLFICRIIKLAMINRYVVHKLKAAGRHRTQIGFCGTPSTKS